LPSAPPDEEATPRPLPLFSTWSWGSAVLPVSVLWALTLFVLPRLKTAPTPVPASATAPAAQSVPASPPTTAPLNIVALISCVLSSSVDDDREARVRLHRAALVVVDRGVEGLDLPLVRVARREELRSDVALVGERRDGHEPVAHLEAEVEDPDAEVVAGDGDAAVEGGRLARGELRVEAPRDRVVRVVRVDHGHRLDEAAAGAALGRVALRLERPARQALHRVADDADAAGAGHAGPSVVRLPGDAGVGRALGDPDDALRLLAVAADARPLARERVDALLTGADPDDACAAVRLRFDPGRRTRRRALHARAAPVVEAVDARVARAADSEDAVVLRALAGDAAAAVAVAGDADPGRRLAANGVVRGAGGVEPAPGAGDRRRAAPGARVLHLQLRVPGVSDQLALRVDGVRPAEVEDRTHAGARQRDGRRSARRSGEPSDERTLEKSRVHRASLTCPAVSGIPRPAADSRSDRGPTTGLRSRRSA